MKKFHVMFWFVVLAAVGPTMVSAETDDARQRMQALITDMVRDNIPHEYEEHDNWGATKDLTVGVKVKLDGLRLQTRRRRKPVKHGTQKLYRVRLVDPDKQFQVAVDNIQELPNGRLGFDLVVDAKLAALGRLSEWRRGVQLISVSAEADARARLKMSCDVALRLDPTRLPPDVVIDPHVSSAKLELAEFRLRRISDLNGPVVKELGSAVRNVVEDKLEDQQHKLPEKINRQIEKNRSKLRLSLHDVLQSQWGEIAQRNITGGDNASE